MTDIFTRVAIKLFCNFIGSDEFGNMYYEHKFKKRPFGRAKRIVLYNGKVEATKVPPQWYSWLHHMSPEAPESNEKAHEWSQDYTPNLTGTKAAYLPSGHPLSANYKRKKSVGDYQAWKPN